MSLLNTYGPSTITIVDWTAFAVAFDAARDESAQIADATSPFEATGTPTLYCLTVDGRSGFAVRQDGELVYVFSTEPGRGDHLISHAVMVGATHLDCFDGYLPTLYGRHGFHRVTSLPNWTEGGPDVVYMARHGHFLAALAKAEA